MTEAKRVGELRARFNATITGSGTRCAISFRDDAPDRRGRRHFTLEWVGTDAIRDGKVRGQCFFARPEDHVTIDTHPQ